MTRSPLFLSVGAALALATGPVPAAAPSSPPEQRVAGVPWAATEIAGRALLTKDPPTIAFLADGTFSMFGGCNRFRGKADLAPGKISFTSPIAGTRMACPPERMKLEQDMLEALARTAGYERNGPLLSLTTDQGAPTARFHERPD